MTENTVTETPQEFEQQRRRGRPPKIRTDSNDAVVETLTTADLVDKTTEEPATETPVTVPTAIPAAPVPTTKGHSEHGRIAAEKETQRMQRMRRQGRR